MQEHRDTNNISDFRSGKINGALLTVTVGDDKKRSWS